MYITGELFSDWRKIVNGLHGQPLRIPRCWFQDLEGDMVHSLQGFCDASKDTYAAVVYLRSASSSGISGNITRILQESCSVYSYKIPVLIL